MRTTLKDRTRIHWIDGKERATPLATKIALVVALLVLALVVVYSPGSPSPYDGYMVIDRTGLSHGEEK